jgi:hypothetical protein
MYCFLMVVKVIGLVIAGVGITLMRSQPLAVQTPAVQTPAVQAPAVQAPAAQTPAVG